jgi:beta-lactamase regulating signal transducer with metallopeptidase domain
MLFMPVLQWALPTIRVRGPERLPTIERLTTLTVAPLSDVPTAAPPLAAVSVDSNRPLPTSAFQESAMPVIPERTGASPAMVAVIAYLVVASGLLLRLFGGWVAVRRLESRTRPASTSDRLPGNAALNVRESDALAVPVTIGLLRPVIVLPTDWKTWPLSKLIVVLAHERAHIRRRDPAITLLARVNRCVFWFHPLAWWLERHLASLAEYACDEATIRDLGERDTYAEVLLDVARDASQAGSRVARQALGIRGHGHLGHRIDHVLGNSPVEPSWLRSTAVTFASAVVVLMAVACAPITGGLTLDSRDDQMAERDAQLSVDIERLMRHWQDDVLRNRAPRQLDQLASRVRSNPDDLEALKLLLVAYWHQASPSLVPARRDLILRLIERHADSQLSGSLQARLLPDGLLPDESTLADPIGYEQGKQIWLRHVNEPRVSAEVLGNAAYFFEWSDPFLAERFLRQAQQIDPKGPWSIRLGLLYASALTGESVLRGPRLMVPGPRTAFGTMARRALAVSTDEVLLTAAGIRLGRGPGLGPVRARNHDPRAWGIECFKRVMQINPKAVLAHSYVLRFRRRMKDEPLYQVPASEKYDQIAALPAAERFAALPDAALGTFREIRHLQATNDRNLQALIDISRRDSRRFAEDALKLAPSNRTHPSYGRAIFASHMTLGSLALENGDRAAALAHLRKASEAPPSEELVYSDELVLAMFAPRLPADLLKLGEREAVIDFLERIARINLAQRAKIRSTIAAIRRGETPDFDGRNV